MLLILFIIVLTHQLYLNPIPTMFKNMETFDINEPDASKAQRLIVQSRISLNWFSTVSTSLSRITVFPSLKATKVTMHSLEICSVLIQNMLLIYDFGIQTLYNISGIQNITGKAYVKSPLH
jgi:hypothetical protein